MGVDVLPAQQPCQLFDNKFLSAVCMLYADKNMLGNNLQACCLSKMSTPMEAGSDDTGLGINVGHRLQEFSA